MTGAQKTFLRPLTENAPSRRFTFDAETQTAPYADAARVCHSASVNTPRVLHRHSSLALAASADNAVVVPTQTS